MRKNHNTELISSASPEIVDSTQGINPEISEEDEACTPKDLGGKYITPVDRLPINFGNQHLRFRVKGYKEAEALLTELYRRMCQRCTQQGLGAMVGFNLDQELSAEELPPAYTSTCMLGQPLTWGYAACTRAKGNAIPITKAKDVFVDIIIPEDQCKHLRGMSYRVVRRGRAMYDRVPYEPREFAVTVETEDTYSPETECL